MGKVIINKVKGMSWTARISLVLIFTLLFSTFMYQGWYRPKKAEAAVAVLDAWTNVSSTAPNNTGGTVSVASQTVSAGSGRLLVVAVAAEAATGATSLDITNVTFGGTALTQIGKSATNVREICYMGYLIDSQIPAGAQTLAVTYASAGATVTGLHIKWGSYSGVDQATPINSSNANYAGGTSVTFGAQINYVLDGWTLYVAANGGSPATMTAPAGFTTIAGATVTTSAHSSFIADTGVHGAAGNYAGTTAVTFGGTTSARSALVVASIRPSAVSATTTLGNGVAGTNATVCPGATGQKLDGFSFVASSGTDSVTALTVTTTGTAAIASMSIYSEDGLTLYFGSVSVPTGNDWSFSGGTAIPVTNVAANFKVLVTYKDHASAPAGDTATTAYVRLFTCTNTQAGTDTADTTLTLNNSAPADATWGTNTAGDTQITLGWTNPADADFSQVVIFRYPNSLGAGSAFDTPVEGATYTQGTNNGLANNNYVAYVGSGTGATDSGLTNGTAYTYKIFAKDNCGNYSAGVQAGPYTPRPTLTVANGASRRAASTLCPGQDHVIDQFKLTASSGTIAVTSITVTGSVTVTGNITGVKLYKDVNNNGTYEGGTDTQVGTTQIFAGNTATFAPISESINTTGTNYLVVYTVAAAPTDGAVVTSQVTAVVAAGANVSNTATVSNNMTLKRYPSLITNFTAVCGTTSATLNWNNPPETNLAEVKVMRKTGGYPTGPSDAGATQVYDNLAPTPGGAVGINDTPLVSGTTYYWAVYSKDSCNNWNTATTAGSNAANCTPTISNTLTVSTPAHPTGGSVAQASSNNIIDRLRFTANAGTITVTSVKLKLLGTAVAGDIASVALYTDTNKDGLIAGETFLGSGVYSSGDNSYTVSGLNFAVTSAAQDMLVVFNISSGAVIGHTLQSQVLNNTYVTVAGSDTVSNTNLPLTSNTFTIIAGGGSSGPVGSPTVQILNPKDGGTVSGQFKVQVQVYWGASALTSAGYSTDGGNTYTNFNLSAQPAGNQNPNYSPGANSAIYEVNLTLTSGAYTFKARGINGVGTGTSRSITVTVRPSAAADPIHAGDGNLLARDNSSQLCMDCHALVTHSSQYTSTTYGNWAINCLDCHKPHEATNIFLINNTINTPNAGNQTVKFWNTTGDDGTGGSSYVHGNSGTDGICQVCHTQTRNPGNAATRWRSGANADTHYTQAAGTARCTTCHPHQVGFKGSCTVCHGNPPIDDSSLIGSTAIFGATGRAGQFTGNGAGKHNLHYNTKGYVCDVCHTGGGPLGNHNKMTSPALLHIGYSLFGGTYVTGGYTAPAFSNTNYNLAAGNAGTTVTTAGSQRTCSSTYCHSPGNKSSAFDPPNVTAVWEGTLNNSCSGCHGNDSLAAFQIGTGSHTKHAITSGYGCTRCHNATVSDNRTVSAQANHVNNLVNVAFDGTAAISGTYNGSASPMTKGPGTAYGSCTNITCHSDGRSVWNGTTGVGNTNVWGSAGGCNNCHGNTTYSDYRKASPLYASTSTVPPGKPNAHDRHTDARTTPSNEPQCKNCHSTVTATNTAIDGTTPANHANGAYNVIAGSTYYDGDNVGGGYAVAVTTSYTYNANPTTSTCSNVSCHPTGIAGTKASSSTKWDTGYNCTDCHNINLTNTTGYHHAMNNTASGYPTTIPDGDATSGTNAASRKCTMCHADHNVFSAMLNANSPGRSYNLRTDIATAPVAGATPALGNYTNSDYATGGGVCISCHTAERTKSGTAVKTETSSTRTPAVTNADFSVSSHQYNVAATMTNGASTFNANCSKCHNAKNNDGQTFQSSTNKFGNHDGTLRRLLAPLGIASPTDPEEEDFCYRCHSKNTDAIGGTVKPAANNDWYGAVTNMTAASQDVYTAMQLGSTGTPASSITTTNTLYFKPTTEYTPPGTLPTTHLPNTDTFSAQTNLFLARGMAPGTPTVAYESHDATGRTVATGTTNWRRVSFISPLVATAFNTPASPWAINIYDRESSANANAYVRYSIYTIDSTGALKQTIITRINWTAEMGTTAAPGVQQAITTANGAAVAVAVGDRIVVDLEIQTVSVTTGGTYSMTYYWGSGATSNVVMPTNVTFTYASPATPASGRHDVAAYSGLHKPSPTDETLAYISANKHVECADCHDPHAASAGNHIKASTALANVLKGTPGTSVTTWPAEAATATWATYQNTAVTYNALSTADAEWKICFKCHSYANTNVLTWGGSGVATWIDAGLEFNPNNQAYHPVVQALPATGNRQLASTALTGGWTPGGVMTCTDCHNTDSTVSSGPHGSSVKWMLNPNTTGTKYYNWPYTLAANNGTSSGTLVTGTGSTTVPGNNFCFSCHVWSGGGAAHTQQGSSHGRACVGCHIRVPHGGKAPRLTTGPNAPGRYKPDGNGGGTTYMNGFTRPASGTVGETDCNTASGCTQHSSTNPITW